MTATLTYVPLETIERADCVAKPSAERVECPGCTKVYGGGSIVTGKPEPDDKGVSFCGAVRVYTWVVLRRTYCDHCDAIISWLEACDEYGVSTGVVHSGPRLNRDRRAIRAFLNAHPEAAGVHQ